MGRKLLIAGFIGVLVMVVLVWWYLQREWLTDDKLAQIRLGMKIEQVENLLGKPCDGYRFHSEENHDSVWIDDTNNFWLIPEDSSLPSLISSGPAIRSEGREVKRPHIGPIRGIPGRSTIPGPKQEWVWVGRKRVLLVKVNQNGVVYEIRVIPITMYGGSFRQWITMANKDWIK